MTWNKKDEVTEKEYYDRENNYKLVFVNDESAKNFVDWVRSTGKDYELKIHSESLSDALREKYVNEIKALEAEKTQNAQATAMPNVNYYDQQMSYQNMMNVMMSMNMMGGAQGMPGGNGQPAQNPMAGFQGMPGMGGGPGGMNQNMMSMLGNMATMNPNMMAMLPPFHNNYYNNNKNMFVRKAKGANGETGGKRRGYQDNREKRSQNQSYGNKQNYSFPANSGAPANPTQGDAKNPSSPTQTGNNYRQPQAEIRKHSGSFARTRIDSDNFPSLPGKVIVVDVPTGPLEDMDLDEPATDKMNKRDIIQKFKEFKEAGKISINKKLKYLSIETYPIITKAGDIRLEELDATLPTQLNVILSEKGSKNPSRKVSNISGHSDSNKNSPFRKPPSYQRKVSENK